MQHGGVGLLDSGVGGLTVLRRLIARHPGLPFVYLGDTARVPYGQKSPLEIRTIAAEVVTWLRHQEVEAVLMACNTTNALAFDIAQAAAGAELPVLGLIDSVAERLPHERVGVLATPATAASGAYGRALRARHPGRKVIEIGCPLFVPLIEAGRLDDPELRAAAAGYLEPLLRARVEAIVLGCTHYPLLDALLRSLLPPEVTLIDPALAAVERLSERLGSARPPVAGPPGRFCVTGDPQAFARSAAPWLGWQPSVEQVVLTPPLPSHPAVGAF